jgi:ABC-2 type transport system ATP-binding protein
MLGEQIHYLYEGLTCGENLQLFINLKNIFGSAGRQELERLLEILHLKDFFNFKVRDLSTGYKKRVALAIALIGNPEILLLDEPLSGIDPENAFYLRRLIEDYSQRATVFWASHNLSEVAGLCGRVLLIKKGRIIFNGIFGTQKGNYLNDLEKVFIELVSSRH